jgi:hypothetical protein
MCYILELNLILAPNGNFWVVAVLQSVRDILLDISGGEVCTCCSEKPEEKRLVVL